MMPKIFFPRRLSIAGALIGNIVLLTVIIGTICAWLMTQWGSTDIRRQEQQRLTLTASGIASLITQAMEERHDEVRYVRDLFERELRDSPAEQKRQVMERIQTGRQHFSWLGLVGADGEILIGTGGLLEGLSVAGRNWFEGARQAPAFFGNIHPATLLESHVRNPDGAPLYLLDIALPLRNHAGETSGVVGSHFNWKMIEDVVSQAHSALPYSRDFAVAVINSDGAILFDNRGAFGNVEELLAGMHPGTLIEAIWANDTEPSFVSTVTVPANRTFDGLGWRIAVRESSSNINASIAEMQWRVAVASLLAGLAFAVLAVFTVRPVTRPLKALIGELNRFGANEVRPMPEKTYLIAEVNNLHQAFFDMATHVVAHKEMLRETQSEIVRTLGRAGEFRDNETGNHVLRMSLCCERLGLLAGWPVAEAEQLRLASQMHDVGKIGIPDNVLLKPGRFEPEERAIMEQHSEIGARILSGIDTPLTVLARTVALTHHEKWDGSGYPHGLAGADIPQAGRIAALCDVFDALLSSRPYKEVWPLDKVVAFLTEQSGQHFDPELVALFLEHLDEFVAIRARFQDEPGS